MTDKPDTTKTEIETPVAAPKKRGPKPKKYKDPDDNFGFELSDKDLEIIDPNLLGKMPDRELAKKWGMSRTKIIRIRNKFEIPPFDYKFNFNKEKTERLLSFLKESEGSVIGIQDIFDLGIFIVDGQYMSKQRIKDFGEKNGIKVSFKSDQNYEHCHRNYMKGCRCDICKLSISVYMKYKRVVSIKFCNYVANEYISLYKQDDTKFHRKFFSMIEEEIDKAIEAGEEKNTTEKVEKTEETEETERDKLILRNEFAKNNILRQELLKMRNPKPPTG